MNAFFESSLLLSWALVCALQDARSRRISNWLTLGMLPLAAAVLWFSHTSLTAAAPADAVMAMLLGAALSLPGYLTGRMGAADVKLLTSLGLASSPMHVLLTVAVAALAMLFWALAGPRLWPQLHDSLRCRLNQLDPANTQAQPYAPFFLVGLTVSLAFIS